MTTTLDTSVQQGMAQAIRLGYRINLPQWSARPGTVALLTLTGEQVDQRDDVAPDKVAGTVAELLQGQPATGALNHGRWGPGARPGYNWQRCQYCGISDKDHARTVCRACDMPQCLYPHHQCPICYVGHIEGVSYGLYGDDRQCGYKTCTNEAVAHAPRVKRVCRDHLARVTRRWGGRTISVADEITQRIAMLGQTSGLRDYRRTYWFADGAR